jgi:hypothetical protein
MYVKAQILQFLEKAEDLLVPMSSDMCRALGRCLNLTRLPISEGHFDASRYVPVRLTDSAIRTSSFSTGVRYR